MTQKGRGSITYDKTGKFWLVKIPIGRKNGRTQYKTKRATSERNARALQAEMLKARQEHKIVAGKRLTFQQWASEYFEYIAPNRLRETSRSKYIDEMNRLVYPRIGHRVLTEITSDELTALFHYLQHERGLSAASVNGVRKNISGVFTQAIKHKKAACHPVKDTDKVQPLPGEEPKVDEPWTQSEALEALSAAKKSGLDAYLHLALGTGMRVGEILGLHWKDIDFRKKLLWVKCTLSETAVRLPNGKSRTELRLNEPKTKSSYRPIPLSDLVIDALSRHRSEQSTQRIRVGPEWCSQDLVFTNKYGKPVYKSNYRDRYETFCRQNNIRFIRQHDIRHTFAVLALENKMPLEAVSQILGHNSVDMTKRVYAKYVHSLSVEVAMCIGRVLDPDQENEIQVRREIPTMYGVL